MVVGFAGSRGVGFSGVVWRAVRSAVDEGGELVVGCAAGADQAALVAALSCRARVTVYAVGEAGGAGFWRMSAPLGLLSRASSVVWLAGGPLSVPLVARLGRRTDAMVRAIARGGPGSRLVAFVAGGVMTPGTGRAVRLARRLGLPVAIVDVLA